MRSESIVLKTSQQQYLGDLRTNYLGDLGKLRGLRAPSCLNSAQSGKRKPIQDMPDGDGDWGQP